MEQPKGMREIDEDEDEYLARVQGIARELDSEAEIYVGKGLGGYEKFFRNNDEEEIEWEERVLVELERREQQVMEIVEQWERQENATNQAYERTLAAVGTSANTVIHSIDINDGYLRERKRLLHLYEETLQTKLCKVPFEYEDDTSLPTKEREFRRLQRLTFRKAVINSCNKTASMLIDRYLTSDTLSLRCPSLGRRLDEDPIDYITRVNLLVHEAINTTIQGYNAYRTDLVQDGDPSVSLPLVSVPLATNLVGSIRSPQRPERVPMSDIIVNRHNDLVQRGKVQELKVPGGRDWVDGYLASRDTPATDVNRLHHWVGVAKKLINGNTPTEDPKSVLNTTAGSTSNPIPPSLLTAIAQAWQDSNSPFIKPGSSASSLVEEYSRTHPFPTLTIPKGYSEPDWIRASVNRAANMKAAYLDGFRKWLDTRLCFTPAHDSPEKTACVPWEDQDILSVPKKPIVTPLVSPRRSAVRKMSPERRLSPVKRLSPRMRLSPVRRPVRDPDAVWEVPLEPLLDMPVKSPPPAYKISRQPISALDKILHASALIVPHLHLMVDLQLTPQPLPVTSPALPRLLCVACKHDAVYMCIECSGNSFCPSCWDVRHQHVKHRKLITPYICFMCKSAAVMECRECRIKCCKSCWDHSHQCMEHHEGISLQQNNYLGKEEHQHVSPQRNVVDEGDVTKMWLSRNPDTVTRVRKKWTMQRQQDTAAIVPEIPKSRVIPHPENVQKLLTFYKNNAPHKMHLVMDVLRNHHGKEEELFASLESEYASASSEPPTLSWSCPSCDFQNADTTTTCINCNTPKP